MTNAEFSAARTVRTGDALQAAQFRSTLAEERERILHHAGKHRDELWRRLEVGTISGVAHLRSQIRSLEVELRQLDDMVAKLDRRFTSQPTTDG